MSDLVHEEVAVTGQIEIVRTGLTFDRPVFRIRITAKSVFCTEVRASVIYPDRAKSSLTIRVGFACIYMTSLRERIWIVGGSTVFRAIERCIRRISRLQNLEIFGAIHDSLAVTAMRTTCGQDHTWGIARLRSTRINIALIRTDQLVKIPVTASIPGPVIIRAIHIGTAIRSPAVDIIIPSSCILRVDFAFAEYLPIRIGSVTQGIVICTRISIKSIVTNQETIAVAQIIFKLPVCFPGKIGLLIGAYAPGHRIHTVVAFGIHQIFCRVFIERLAVNNINFDMCTCINRVSQPTIAGRRSQISLIQTGSVRHISVQHRNRTFVFCAGSRLNIIAVIINDQIRVAWNLDLGNIIAAMRPEQNGLAVPLREDFHGSIGEIYAVIKSSLSCRHTEIVQYIRFIMTTKAIPAESRPISLGLCFRYFIFCQPFVDTVIGIFR